MPITASFGALTYNRGAASTWQYWSCFFSGNVNDLFGSTFSTNDNNLYVVGAESGSAGTNPYPLYINININKNQSPTIAWYNRMTRINSNTIQNTQGNSFFVSTINSNSNIITIDQNFNSVALNVNRGIQVKNIINSVTGNIIGNSNIHYSILSSNTTNFLNSFATRYPTDYIYNGNTFFTTGLLNQPPAANVNNSKIYVTNYYTNNSAIIFDKEFGFTGNTTVIGQPISDRFDHNPKINLDSSNNIIITGNPTTSNSYINIIANVNTTFTSINWQKNISYLGNNQIFSLNSVVINNNTFVIFNTANTVTLTKFDNTGNILWSKNSPNVKVFFNQIIKKSNNSLIFSGATGNTDNEYLLIQVDTDSGNIIYQNKLSYSNVSSYKINNMCINQGANQIAVIGNIYINPTTPQGTISVVPIDGEIYGNGVYNIYGNISLTYSTSNINWNDITLTSTNGNCVIITPNNSTYANINPLTDSNVNITATFNRIN